MRIAFIIDQFPALSETFILNQITGLIDRGHEVDIYPDLPGDTSKMHPDVEKYQLLDRTYYSKMPSGRLLRTLKGSGLLLGNFSKDPVVVLRSLNVFKYKFSEYGEQGKLLKLFYATVPFLEKQPYDIIHCHYGRNGIRGLLLREIGILQGKLITSFHGFDISSYLTKYGERIYNQLFGAGDMFLPISEAWKRRLMELGCNENKIVVHRMGIDGKKFSFTPHRLQASGKIKIVTIARLVEKKGVEYGIRAVAKLAKVKQNIEYNIIGDGPLKENLQQLIDELDAADTVKLLGWKQQRELIEILNQAHIMLAPSVTSKDGDREGIPVTLMEAMAMGLPILSTQHSGIPELVKNGESGFLVPERDAEALTQKLAYLLDRPEMWPDMGRAGRTHVEEHYDINKLNDRLVEIYQNLLTEV